MGVSNFNTVERDQLLVYAKTLKSGGVRVDNAIEIPQLKVADFVHLNANTYFCDVSAVPSITVTIPYEQDTAFRIYDSHDALVGAKKIILSFLDSDGVTVRATFNLTSRNRNWVIFKVDDFWYVNRADKGVIDGPF